MTQPEMDFERLSAEMANNPIDAMTALRENNDTQNFLEHKEQFDSNENEFGRISEESFLAAVKTILLSRNLSRNFKVSSTSIRRMKKSAKQAIAFGEVAEYFTQTLLGWTKAPQLLHGDDLFIESSHMFIAVRALFDRKIYLRSNNTGVYARFAWIHYYDSRGDKVPVNDWGLLVVDGKRVFKYELPLSPCEEGSPTYFYDLAEKANQEGWTPKFVTY